MLCGIAAAGWLTVAAPVPSSQARGPAQAQKQGPPGTFRIRVLLVPIDVIVTDDRDRPVTDLKQEDFQIFENGRPQEVRHFAVQTFTAAMPPGPAQPSSIRISNVIEPKPQSARTFLILLGRGRHQQALKAVDALIQFVRQDLLPQDRIAVYAYNRATDFTTDHEQVAQVLEQYKKVSDNIESWLELNVRGLRTIYGIKELPKSLQPEVARIFEGTTNLASRQVPPGRLTAEGKIVKDWELAASLILGTSDRAAEAEQRVAVADDAAESGLPGAKVMQSLLTFDEMQQKGITLELPFDEFIPRAGGAIEDMQNLFTCIEYLRYMEGEKHLLFFSGQGLLFPYGNTDYDKGIAAMANDARVAIDTFHTGGLPPTVMPTKGVTLTAAPKGSTGTSEPPPPMGSVFSAGDTAQAQSLRNIAAITGGRASIFQDIGGALDTVNETTRVQYLLGYYPADENWNDKYRQIQVKVNRPGLRLYFRRGYFARDTLQPYDRIEFLAYSRISAAGGWADVIDDVPFKISAARSAADAGPSQLNVDLKINASKIALRTDDNIHYGRLRLAIFYADGRQHMLGEVWKTVGLKLLGQTYKEYMKSGIPVSVAIPAQAGDMYLTAVVYDMAGDKVGSRRLRVDAR